MRLSRSTLLHLLLLGLTSPGVRAEPQPPELKAPEKRERLPISAVRDVGAPTSLENGQVFYWGVYFRVLRQQDVPGGLVGKTLRFKNWRARGADSYTVSQDAFAVITFSDEAMTFHDGSVSGTFPATSVNGRRCYLESAANRCYGIGETAGRDLWLINLIQIDREATGQKLYETYGVLEETSGNVSQLAAAIRTVKDQRQQEAAHARLKTEAKGRQKKARAIARRREGNQRRGRPQGGELILTNIQRAELFQQIYDEDFIQLSRPVGNNDFLPHTMLSGVISSYSELCRSSLSPSAVKVDIYDTRYLRSEHIGFVKTEYYERYLAETVYMEGRYEEVFRSSVLTFLTKAYQSWSREPGDLHLLEYYMYVSRLATEAVQDFRQLVANHDCDDPAVKNFIDNLHIFVSGNWSTKRGDTYEYVEEEVGFRYIRYYAGVPASFSPKFPVPDDEKHIVLYLDHGVRQEGLVWLNVAHFGDYHRREIGSSKDKRPHVPQYVYDAIDENKYFTARCTYHARDGSVSIYYWNKNAPLPSAQVREFMKEWIKEPREACPVGSSR